MVEAGSIEALAFHFTAGAVAGALLLHLSADPYLLSGGLLILLCFLLAVLVKTGRTGLVLPAFLLCGMWCVLTDALPGGGGQGFLQCRAAHSALRLRIFIDSLPFTSEVTAPLLKAFLTGDRSGLSPETILAFRQSGASHLLALSGLHMGILYLFLARLLWPLGNSLPAKRFRYVLLVGAAGFFTWMTGASPSLVRAFLFIILRETARLAGRPTEPVRILGSALLLQLVLMPSAITSVGFQLSYLAMAGIFFLFPRLEAWYPPGHRFNPLRKIWKAAALSLSCQAFTAPLAWLRFHTFPVHFLLTNLLAMPMTTLMMGLAAATLLLQAAGCCPDVLLRATDLLATNLVRVLEIISSM